MLNWDPFKDAKILITEKILVVEVEYAPWSLLDFGIKCIIAPSFADIFFNNCFKNGILPIKLEQNKVDILLSKANKKETLVIDLENQSITQENGEFYKFEVDKFRKKCLLEGLDDIALTLKIKKYK